MSNKQNDTTNDLLKKHLKYVERSERYFFYEKEKGKILSYDDTLFYSSKSITEIINHRNKLNAMRKAIKELSEEQKSYIEEFFFEFREDKKENTYTYLAKRRGINRKSYVNNLQRYLSYLRKITEKYYDEF